MSAQPAGLAVQANRLVDDFTRGRLADLLDMFAFPLAVYAGDRVFVFGSGSELIEGMTAYRGLLVKAGLALIETTIQGTPRHSQRQFTLRVRNRYFDRSGTDFDHSEITYFMERTDDGTRALIRLVEYDRWPLADDLAGDPVLAALSQHGAARPADLGAH
jgi:hypothetical protein